MSVLCFTVAAALTLPGSDPVSETVAERVDLIELNHFYDDRGRLVFDQLIFYEWSPWQHRYHVRDWRMIKNRGQLPERDWRRNQYRVRWFDGDVPREVTAPVMQQTWTQHDPELVNRQYLPKDVRRGLRDVTRPVSSGSP